FGASQASNRRQSASNIPIPLSTVPWAALAEGSSEVSHRGIATPLKPAIPFSMLIAEPNWAARKNTHPTTTARHVLVPPTTAPKRLLFEGGQPRVVRKARQAWFTA